MTIPNVVIRWCRHQAKCRWCEQPILKATPMVEVFVWNKGNPEKRGWNYRFYFHPQCWVDQGLDYLNKNPYIPPRGRAMALSDNAKRERFLLIRRYNELKQRKGKIKADYPDRLIAEARIEKKMVDIMLDVHKIGGIPKSWLIQ